MRADAGKREGFLSHMEPDACLDLRKTVIHTRDATRKLTGDVLLQSRNHVAPSDSHSPECRTLDREPRMLVQRLSAVI